MARPIWRGSINFGLVTVPVELYSAIGDHTVRFRQFERDTSDRIRYRRVNERTGREVSQEDIVKGYPLEDGDYVLIDPAELDEIAPGRSRTIDIQAFVTFDDIDPVFFDKSYWLVPSDEGFAKAYHLLMRAMTRSGKAGVARFVMRGKEHLAAIRPGEHVMLMDTLRFAEDIRAPEEELDHLPELPQPGRKELDMAVELVESMHEEWDPSAYPDTYNERVLELIESKREGRSVVTESEPPQPTNVVDLFDALSRSVGGQRGKRGKACTSRGGASRGGASKGHKGSRQGPDLSELSKTELESMARELDIKGRSTMNRAELASAIEQAPSSGKRSAS